MNKALFSKISWKILQEPDCLFAKVLQAKYFSRGNFLEAPRGHLYSYLWSSILWGRELILKGLGWNIAKGTEVDVWHDNWIPSSDFFQTPSEQIH